MQNETSGILAQAKKYVDNKSDIVSANFSSYINQSGVTEETDADELPYGFSTVHGQFAGVEPYSPHAPNPFWSTILTMGGLYNPEYKAQIAIPWASDNEINLPCFRVKNDGIWGNWLNILTDDRADKRYPNPNILINPDFRINQRGSTNYAAGNWSVDGWLCHQCVSATVLDTGEIKLTSTAFNSQFWAFSQPVSLDKGAERLYGKSVTISVYVSAITGSTDWILHSTNGLDKDLTLKVGLNTITETLTEANFGDRNGGGQRFGIAFRTAVDGGTITLKYIKVEIGDTATLFTPPNPEEELLKCRERYQEFTGNLKAYGKTDGYYQFSIPTPHAADGTAFTAAFKDIAKLYETGGLILSNTTTSAITKVDIKAFSLYYDTSVKTYLVNAVPSSGSTSGIDYKDTLLGIGPNCPIVFTHE